MCMSTLPSKTSVHRVLYAPLCQALRHCGPHLLEVSTLHSLAHPLQRSFDFHLVLLYSNYVCISEMKWAFESQDSKLAE